MPKTATRYWYVVYLVTLVPKAYTRYAVNSKTKYVQVTHQAGALGLTNLTSYVPVFGLQMPGTPGFVYFV